MFDNGVKANDGSSRSVLYMCEDMTSEGGGEASLAWLNAEQGYACAAVTALCNHIPPSHKVNCQRVDGRF
jgi:hypothetical protein